ncbi:MAG: riboflavin synthase subunit alpha [Pseudomonadota bacterium]
MFTGIVQGLCPIMRVTEAANLRRLAIDLGELAAGVELGASVAVNGTCLTVTGTEGNGGVVLFDVIQETLNLTNLGGLAEGDLVNVERSFRVGDEVGGHIVSGHVAGKATVSAIEEAENLRNVFFSVPDASMKFLHHKGFVALDGASLTLATVDQAKGEVSVSLIPETIERTTLGVVEVGDPVNLEVDAQTQAVVETVERLLQTPELLERVLPQDGESGYKSG